jgi:four helix bundle protein
MARVQSFEDLEVWKKARLFSNAVYEITLKESFSKDFELKKQIHRSSGSIMDNIAEGFERSGNKEFGQFLAIAKGSAGETRSQLYRALDRKHIDEVIFDHLKSEAIAISRMISALMNYLKTTEKKGAKYKVNEDGQTYHLK